MTVTLNNQSNNGIYVFSEQPNILKFEYGDFPVSNPSRMFIDCPNGMESAGNVGEVIEVNGEQITSVAVQSDAGVRQFAISSVALTTANSICNALRSISSLLSNYDIYFGATSNGARVTLYARQNVGFQLTGSCTDSEIEITTVDAEDAGIARKASVRIDAFSKYLTTLEKVICSQVTSFDLTPVLSSVADYGTIGQVVLTPWTSDENLTVTTARTFNCSVIKGYHTEGQPLYITSDTMLQNVQGTLYTYDGNITFSYLGSGEIACTVKTRGSDFSVIDSDSYDFEADGLTDCTFNVSGLMTGETFYIDVELPNDTLLRYNVIKPSRMTEGAVRVNWRGSMGGLEFFDFTGKQSKKNAISHELYRNEQSSYSYYDDGLRMDRLTRMEENIPKTTLRSHIVKGDSLFIFDSLARSGRVWIDDNLVIITDIRFNEQNNNTFIVEVDYELSRNN